MTPLNDKALEAAERALDETYYAGGDSSACARAAVIAYLSACLDVRPIVDHTLSPDGEAFIWAEPCAGFMVANHDRAVRVRIHQTLPLSPKSTNSSGWCSDMSAAPRDRNIKIDLWLMSRLTGRHLGRMTDCYWGNGWQRDGKFICGRWYVDDGGHDCLDPLCEDEESIVATHWRPLPEPPGGKGE